MVLMIMLSVEGLLIQSVSWLGLDLWSFFVVVASFLWVPYLAARTSKLLSWDCGPFLVPS
jgi:hypothetical protein